ncbi:hypothetical protein [Pseudomonas sp. dw_612]|uniref:hypothetical protein n=1 Tax=Pseudomonas sp. dw_612 TaxID=2720080 RepID=UPI001BD29707|nr:hypothetical protein [Pseudomonas sp. dw_612]
MDILLSPYRGDESFVVEKLGNTLTINGELFDFSRMVEGDTLPQQAITSQWFAEPLNFVGGKLVVTLRFPNPVNFSQEQAFPVPMLDVPDGPVVFPGPRPEVSLPDVQPETVEDES